MPARDVRRWQITIRQIMAAIVVCAVGLAWPTLLIAAAGVVLSWCLMRGAIDFADRGHPASVVVLVVIGLVLFTAVFM